MDASELTSKFEDKENLFRAIYPETIRKMYWKADGKLSSAAFKDKKGLSVDRSGNRSNIEVYKDFKKRFKGHIFYVNVKQCKDLNILLKYLPSNKNKYHCELHKNETEALLDKYQCKQLAKLAIEIEF